MKIKMFSSVLFSLLLAACAAQPAAVTATLASTLVLPNTPTSIFTSTPIIGIDASELTPAPSQTNAELLDIIFTDTHEMTVAGVPIVGTTSVDSTARGFGLHELTIDPNTLDDLSARALHNFFVPGGTDNNAEAVSWMKECKAGIAAQRTESVYTTTGGMQPEELDLVMDCGQEIPDGSVVIKGVEFVYGKWFERTEGNNGGVYSANPEMPWLSMIVKTSGELGGLLVDKDTGVLKIFMGLPFNTDAENIVGKSGIETEISLYWLNRYPKPVNLKSAEPQYQRSKEWAGSVRTK